jgi:hypothetical protein
LENSDLVKGVEMEEKELDFEIKRLKVNPGDVLLVMVNGVISQVEADALKKRVADWLPIATKIEVVNADKLNFKILEKS